MQQQAVAPRSPITFLTPAGALGWADSIIAVGRCDSQFRRILRDAVEQGGRVSSGVTLDDLHCIAHDISNALRRVQSYAEACAFRHLYGLPSAHETVQATFQIADKLEECSEGLRKYRLRALALAALNSEKAGQKNNRYYSASRYARSIGISRQSFHESDRWVELRNLAVKEVRGMLQSAERQFSEALVEKGVM